MAMKKNIAKSMERIKVKGDEAQFRVMEAQEKNMLDVMGKVIVKHSDKQKKINKANKEAAKDREYAIAENLDKEIAFKQKLKGIW